MILGRLKLYWLMLWTWSRGQIWILPILMSAGFAALAMTVLEFGPDLDRLTPSTWWLFSGDAQTARDLLGNILSGLITMTSMVLSMTFVVLTLSANQLGPRLVSILTGDREIQSVIGLFVGTITYTLIILRTLNDDLGPNGVPHSSISVASALVLICLVALLFYVHKISRSIIVDIVIERVSCDLQAAINEILVTPDKRPQATSKADTAAGRWISIGKSGYVQAIDYDSLIATAADVHGEIELSVKPGDFVLRGGDHIHLRANHAPSGRQMDDILAAFQIGAERSPAQDLEYAFRQLVESGTRALSPGQKDPFTVIAVLDKLSAAIALLCGERVLPPRCRPDENGVIRLRAVTSDVPGLIDIAFEQFRQGAAGEPATLGHLADTCGRLLGVATNLAARQALHEHLDRLEDTMRTSLAVACDRTQCLARLEAARTSHPRRLNLQLPVASEPARLSGS